MVYGPHVAPRKKQLSDIIRALTDDDGRLLYATSAEDIELSDAPDAEVESEVTWPVLTANQLVAYNVQRARKARGWSQEVLGGKLERMTGRVWSKTSVSAAESSWRGGRVRKFDANELLAFSIVFDLPIAFMFLPPDDDPELEHVEVVADVLGEVGIPVVDRDGLLALVDPSIRPPRASRRTRRALGQAPESSNAEGTVTAAEALAALRDVEAALRQAAAQQTQDRDEAIDD
jgi:transcriptional regulator with XRE-family HTH domain